jgi:hypothetical protein
LTQLTDTGDAEVRLGLGIGNGRINVDAKVQDLTAAEPNVDLALQTLDLHWRDLDDLGLPQEVMPDGIQFALRATGNPQSPGALKLEANAGITQLRAPGTEIEAVSIGAKLDQGRLHLQSTVSHGENEIELEADATLPETWNAWEKIEWTAELNADLPEATAFLDEPLPFTGLLNLTADADGRGATPRQAKARIQGETLAWEQWTLPEFRSDLAINGQQAEVKIPELPLGAGNTFTADIELGLEKPMPTQIAWKLLVSDPQALLSTTGLGALDAKAGGHVETQGDATFDVDDLSQGDLSELTANATIKVKDARYDEVRIDALVLAIDAGSGLAKLRELTLRIDETNGLEAEGQIALAEPRPFEIDADLALPEVTRFNAMLARFGAPELQSGSVESRVSAKGQISPWQCDGSATAEVVEFQMPSIPEPVGLELSSTFAGTAADLETVRVEMGDWKLKTVGRADESQVNLQRLTLHQADRQILAGHLAAPYDIATLGVEDGADMDIQIDISDLAVDEVLAAAGIDGMPGGRLHAEIALRGRPETVAGHLRLNWRDLTVPQSPLNLKPAQVEWETLLENGTVTSNATVAQPPLQTLTFEAGAPLSLSELIAEPDAMMDTPIEAKLNLPRSSLGFLKQLAPDVLESLPLTLALNAQVSGTASAPKVNAALDADAPEIQFAKADLPSVRDVKVRIRSEDSLVRIQDLAAVLAGGHVKLGGTIDATDPTVPVFDLNLGAKEALVFRDPDTSVRANADINVNGTAASSRVTGLAEVVRGRVFKEIDFVPFAIPNPDLPAVPPSTAKAEKKLVLPEALKDWSFDVDVRTRDPIRISGNIAVGAVSADVNLGGTGATPLLTGAANIDEALLQLPFSRLKLTKGVITLKPEEPFNPDLDIRGQSQVGQHDITLYVYGAATDPKTRFTSVPPLSEADTATLLATGTTLDGSASEVASEATTRALFLIASQLYRKVFNKRKKISEEPPKLSMTFNPSGADRQNDSVQAAYQVTPKLRVSGRFRQDGQMKMMLGYLMRFGEAARAMDETNGSTQEATPEAP